MHVTILHAKHKYESDECIFDFLSVTVEASRGAGRVRFPLEEMKYLIFSFLCSGVKAKRGVDLCHSTRNVSRIRRKMGNKSVLTLGSLCQPCCVRDTA